MLFNHHPLICALIFAQTRVCAGCSVRASRVEEKLGLCSRSIQSMLRASTGRAFYHWKSNGLTERSVMDVKSQAVIEASRVSVTSGLLVLERVSRHRSRLRLRSCLDRWFLAVHSKELQVRNHSLFSLLHPYNTPCQLDGECFSHSAASLCC